MITSIIIVLLLIAFAGFANSVMDTVDFHYGDSIFSNIKGQCRIPGLRNLTRQQWWNQSQGWKNKYKNRDPEKGPAFPGSTTVFVFVTDSWHFFQMLFLTALQLSILVVTNTIYTLDWWMWLVGIAGMKMLYGATFELFFKKILKKKQ